MPGYMKRRGQRKLLSLKDGIATLACGHTMPCRKRVSFMICPSCKENAPRIVPRELGAEPQPDPEAESKDRMIAEVLDDWARLKRLEDNLRAVYQGRDLLRELESMQKDRDGWAKIAMDAQARRLRK